MDNEFQKTINCSCICAGPCTDMRIFVTGFKAQLTEKNLTLCSRPQLFVYRGVPMLHFKEIYSFPRFRGRGPTFSRCGGGWLNCLFLRKTIELVFFQGTYHGTYQQSCLIEDGRSKYRVVHYWHYQRYADFKCVSSFAFS